MRNIIVILLLGCLFTYMGGYWLVGRYQQFTLKKEMRARLKTSLSSSETEQFVFTLANGDISTASFKWEDDHEFHYKGNLYDVIEKKISGNKLYITCINDSKEKELINHYINITKKQNSKPGSNNNSVQQLLSLIFLTPQGFTVPVLHLEKRAPSGIYNFQLLSRSSDILIPPPQA